MIHRRYFAGIAHIIAIGAMILGTVKPAAAVVPDTFLDDIPKEIAVDFDDPLDLQFVKLQVLDDKGDDHAVGPPMISVDRRRLSVRVEGLKPGVFVVKWGVIDHHGKVIQGSFTFALKRPKTLAQHWDFEAEEAHRHAIGRRLRLG